MDWFPKALSLPKKSVSSGNTHVNVLNSYPINGVKKRFQNAFTVCNAALDAVVSDMSEKSASAITDYLIHSDSFDPDTCKSFLYKSLKKKGGQVIESIEGYQMTTSQKERMDMIHAHLDFVNQMIEKLDTKLDGLIAPYENAVTLLCTNPETDRQSAITILSEIGTGMKQFNSSKRLCCWVGLTPDNNESADKKKSVRITRAEVCLKSALVQCAHAAVKSKTNPYYRNKYGRIAKRRGKKRAIIAIARMILTALYHMLSTGEKWNPCDLYKTDTPPEMQERQKQKAVKQAYRFLISVGELSADSLALHT